MLGELPHPFLFIHIPKTAGTSVENALIPVACGKKSITALTAEEQTRHALPGGKRMPTTGTYRVRGGVVQHECVAYFQDLGELDGREIVSVVRNPYDRALSEIFYLLRLFPAAADIFRGPTWADDLKAYAAYDGYLAHDLKACQIDWLMDREEQLRCDRILRFETLDTDWLKLCADWGLDDVPLPHANAVGRSIPWWEYYDEEAARAIAEKYARDFELLGYDTALPVTDETTKRQRTLWLGEGAAPDPRMFTVNPSLRHGRLEIPHQSMGAVHVHGNLERLSYEETKQLLNRYRNFLIEGGEMILHTLDLEFIASLVTTGYEEGSVQDHFVRSYVDEFMPVGSYYSPAAVLSHLLLHKGFVTLYDRKLLENLLASIALTCTEVDRSELGVLKIHARTATS
jgi:hypothetical protein